VQLPLLSLLALGRGYGHGVGMSQWGALGLAQRGESYDQILRHYYRGTELRPYASP
jgi:stage II sporulation protein D